MSIHYTDPFATPEPERSPVRRLRGRVVSPVTLWSAPGPAGLTVSSTLVADGEPGRVLGLVDDESELWDALTGSGRFAISLLEAGDQLLADRFAGLAPAPGGLFAQDQWQQTEFGPVPTGNRSWVGCMLDVTRGYGWGMLVEGTIAQVHLSTEEQRPLAYHRGRYHAVGEVG